MKRDANSYQLCKEICQRSLAAPVWLMAIYQVQAHPRAAKPRVELRDGVYHVYVHSSPEKGRATEEVREQLAAYLGLPRSRLICRSGDHSRRKLFETME